MTKETVWVTVYWTPVNVTCANANTHTNTVVVVVFALNEWLTMPGRLAYFGSAIVASGYEHTAMKSILKYSFCDAQGGLWLGRVK